MLKERIQSARNENIPRCRGKIIVVENKADLIFEDVSLDRRGFFQTLKTMGFTQIAGVIDKEDVERPVSYTEKRLPLKREPYSMPS